MQHGRDHDNRFSHKDLGRMHRGRTDLDLDEIDVEGLKQKDVRGRPAAKKPPYNRK
jgi:hypothetical protein